MSTEDQSSSATPVKSLALKILGVGGAGINAVAHMGKSDLAELTFACLHTNASALDGCGDAARFLLGRNLLHGLGAGGDPALGKAAAEEELTRIEEFCAGTDFVFVVAGLGGGTGTGSGPIVARAAKESGALVVALVTLPFEFEGGRRQRQALAGFQQFKAAADAVICVPNQKLFKLIDEKTSVLEAFRITNDLLAQGIRGIWQMLTQPGLIQVDFADLCSVVRGRHAESSFATAQAEGDARAREVMERLLASPLFEGAQTLHEADALLVNITGGPDLTMSEVNRVMERINREAENAQIIMGATIRPELKGRLILTAVASRRGHPPEPADNKLSGAEPAPEPEFDTPFFNPVAPQRPASRFVPPAPALTPETAERLLAQTPGARPRNAAAKLRQGQLPLEIVSKGRFQKTEPTVHRGEDLDVPTYIRRGVPLN